MDCSGSQVGMNSTTKHTCRCMGLIGPLTCFLCPDPLSAAYVWPVQAEYSGRYAQAPNFMLPLFSCVCVCDSTRFRCHRIFHRSAFHDARFSDVWRSAAAARSRQWRARAIGKLVAFLDTEKCQVDVVDFLDSCQVSPAIAYLASLDPKP